jgi:hypothetical protein
VRTRWPAVTLLETGRNLGFAAANNVGIHATTGELILLLNSDTVVPAGAVDALVRALRATPEAAAAGPRLIDAAGRPELSFGRMIGPLNELRQKVLGRLYARGVGAVVRRIAERSRRRHFPDWVSGACLLVRRSDAEGVGLLDERFFMYGEAPARATGAVRARGRSGPSPRAIGRVGPRSDRPRLPAQSGRLLRQAPPGVGAMAAAVSAAARYGCSAIERPMSGSSVMLASPGRSATNRSRAASARPHPARGVAPGPPPPVPGACSSAFHGRRRQAGTGRHTGRLT